MHGNDLAVHADEPGGMQAHRTVRKHRFGRLRHAAATGVVAASVLTLLLSCGSEARRPDGGPSSAATASPTTGQRPPSPSPGTADAAPPAATVQLHDLHVGQALDIRLAKVTGWSEPRSSNPSVLSVIDISDAGEWHLHIRVAGPGSALLLSQFDPCTGVADTTQCSLARSAKTVIYLDVQATA